MVSSFRLRRAAGLAALAALTLATVAPAQQAFPAYREGDESVMARNVLPPGQGRFMNGPELVQAQATGEQPPMNTNQIGLYDSLVQATPGLTLADIPKYFKDASFGVPPTEVDRVYRPRPGVTVVRDRTYQVPHVYGDSRADTMFGTGYVSAEDRLFMMDVLRHTGRGRLSQFLGASDSNLQMDRAQLAGADYTEEELQAMIDRLPKVDPVLGAQAKKDLEDYTAGVNAYITEALTDPRKLPGEYEALQQVPLPWKVTDSVATASLIGAQLGVGGGAELRNAAFVSALSREGYPPSAARAILADFRFANDPEAPTTTSRSFPWMQDLGSVDPASVAMPDDAAPAQQAISRSTFPDTIDGPFGPIRLGFPEGASNALLVGSKLSATRRPLAVFGPQVGYWSPEILMEIDMHGPGIHARGAAFPGISLYVLLGRG
ncbi:MAG TPA: penicillin acylase family protein, partial [Actinomycetota bacterium]|nr:penicillin acylase family protein [Actinomycetota bacterium]